MFGPSKILEISPDTPRAGFLCDGRPHRRWRLFQFDLHAIQLPAFQHPNARSRPSLSPPGHIVGHLAVLDGFIDALQDALSDLRLDGFLHRGRRFGERHLHADQRARLIQRVVDAAAGLGDLKRVGDLAVFLVAVDFTKDPVCQLGLDGLLHGRGNLREWHGCSVGRRQQGGANHRWKEAPSMLPKALGNHRHHSSSRVDHRTTLTWR